MTGPSGSSDYSGKFIKSSFPSDGVLHIQMARGPVNAFHDAFWMELESLVDRASADPGVSVVVLSSALPKVYTAGLDLNAAATSLSAEPGSDPSRVGLIRRAHVLAFQDAISSLERCIKPVITAIHGLCYGLGIDIASACDVRFAATSSRFSIKEVDVGLAADIGSLARLPKITGNESLLRELAFTARDFGAEEALKLGFLSKVVEGSAEEVQAEALKVAATIAGKSPIAVLGTKHLLLHARDHGVRENLEYTATWNQLMLQSDDLTAAVKAFMTKKPAQFKPLPKL